MEVKEIRALIDFISETGLAEVNIKTKEFELSVRRHPKQVVKNTENAVSVAPLAQQVVAPKAEPAKEVSAPVAKNETPTAPAVDESRLIAVRAPMIGTFYRSASPENPPFAKVGDKINKGQTVCIIEAMKLFNEIESDISGTVVKVGVENASPVEYDQILFLVDPA
jgi:acetyl-CoA carboxylase biotin carboxyl carrier protein